MTDLRTNPNFEAIVHLAAVETTAPEWPVGLLTAMRTVISLALLMSSLFVIISREFREKDRNWAYTTIGALTGFWLRDLS
jgi:hypothetical protein